MEQIFIEDLLNNPYGEKKIKFTKDDYVFEESFEAKTKSIEGMICCSINGKKYRRGSVSVYFDINEFKKNHEAGFADLEVHTEILHRGVGKALMLTVFDVIKDFKKYYCINETISLRGWLSLEDKRRPTGWPVSVPFYEKVAHLAGVECFFTIHKDNQHYNANEFLTNANCGGSVTFLV